MRPRPGPAAQRRGPVLPLLVALLALLLPAGALVALSSERPQRDRTQAPVGADDAGRRAAEQFLDEYVEPDGRVVRRDQGGDTVSEGQAYALLLAVAADREEVFASVWQWTQEHLARPDGLLSWQWRDGAVVDPESAADADLDAARALVLAGERFERPAWSRDGGRLARAVLEAETVGTPAGRVLTAGTWVDAPPWAVNPSYASPAATALLAEATQEPRWRAVQDGNRALVRQLVQGDRLPPDWARVQRDGSAQPAHGPQGESPRFGYDAARTPLRFAEACDAASRDVAAQLRDQLTRTEPGRAVYDLAGSPQTGDTHPLAHAALAAAHAASGDDEAARAALDEASAAQRENPTYYGAAWVALGRVMLTDDVLGGCPPLAADDAVAAPRRPSVREAA